MRVMWAEANVWNWTPVITIVCFYRCTSTGSAWTEITSVSHDIYPVVCSSLLAARIIEDVWPDMILYIHICTRVYKHIWWKCSSGYLAAEFRVHWHFRARAEDPVSRMCIHVHISVIHVWNYFKTITTEVRTYLLMIGYFFRIDTTGCG